MMRSTRYKLIACSAMSLIGAISANASESGVCLVQAARAQVGVTTIYDPAYRRMPYPNGDVPSDRGVCTDVVIRAYRAFDIDLQRLVHEDMKTAWPKYPKLWGLTRPDTNIDHRRVPNLATYFERHGQTLSSTTDPSAYLAGDIVTWRLTSGVPHIGIISNRHSPSGVPLVIHNIGAGTLEEDILLRFEITGHYRHGHEALTCRDTSAGGGEGSE